MRLASLKATNFRSLGDVTVSFDEGLTAIVGLNGSGKSSVFEAVLWALYGSSEVKQGELITRGENNMSVVVSTHTHTVKRSIQGGIADLQLHEGEKNLSQPMVTGTEAEIAKLFGNRTVAEATWFARQGEMNKFVDASPSARRDMLGAVLKEVVPVDWEGKHENAKKLLAKTKDDLQNAKTELAVLTKQQDEQKDDIGDLKELETAYNELRDKQRVLSSLLIRAESGAFEAREKHDEAKLKFDDIKHRHSSALDKFKTIARSDEPDILERDWADAQQAETEHKQGIIRWQKAQEAVTPLKQTLADFEVVINYWRTITVLMASFDALDADKTPTCDRCGQDVKDASLERSKQSITAQIQEARNLVKGMVESRSKRGARAIPEDWYISSEPVGFAKQQHTKSSKELDGLLAIKPPPPPRVSLASLASQKERNAKIIAERTLLTDEIEELTLGLVSLKPSPKLEAERNRTRDEVAKAREGVTLHNNLASDACGALEACKTVSKSRQTAQRRIKTLTDAIAGLETGVTTLEGVKRAVSANGVRQLLIDRIAGSITTMANKVLTDIDAKMRVHLLTQTPTMKETLEIVVEDETGSARPWHSYSGGEKCRVALALRRAFAQALSELTGHGDLPLFVLDEAFGSQDEIYRANLVGELAKMAKAVKQVIVISHDHEFVQGCEQIIKMNKSAEGLSEVTNE